MEFPERGKEVSDIPDIPPFMGVEISIDLVEDMHPQNSPVVLEARLCSNPLIAVQCPPPEDLEVRHFCLRQELTGLVPELQAMSDDIRCC